MSVHRFAPRVSTLPARPQAAAAALPATAPPVETAPAFVVSATLSLNVDVIAESLYCARQILEGRDPELVPFRTLPARVCQVYRDRAVRAVLGLCPWAHAAAATEAARVARTVGFDAALERYHAALIATPVRLVVPTPLDAGASSPSAEDGDA